MLKLIGMGCIMTACVLIGRTTAQSYALRPLQLRTLLQGLQYLETEIIYSCNPLPTAIASVGEKLSGEISRLFLNTANILHNNPASSPKHAWDEAYKSLKEKLHLRPQDQAILNAFLMGLGQSHREDQLKQISLVKELLNAELEKALEESKKFVRMYNSLGVSIGLTIIILLF